MTQLVLSLFPGVDILGLGFEGEGFCVVQGPDIQWGRSIIGWSPPAGRFDGVIGGPPCQAWSRLAHLARASGAKPADDLIPEFLRCVTAARPAWWLMENVPDAPVPAVAGYTSRPLRLNNRWLGEVQQRTRRFTFGSLAGLDPWPGLQLAALESPEWAPAVVASGEMVRSPRVRANGRTVGYTKNSASRASVSRALALQGLPSDFFAHSPLTTRGQQRLIGNAVSLPMARAVARAVRLALEADS